MSEVIENKTVERAVFRVAPPDISATWAMVKNFFNPIWADCQTHVADDVLKILLLQQSQLWVQWNSTEGKIEAAFVTEFIGYPKGMWIRLWLGGGAPDAKVDYQAVRGALTVWARQNCARGFEIIGRHGWLRKFHDAKVEGLCMR